MKRSDALKLLSRQVEIYTKLPITKSIVLANKFLSVMEDIGMRPPNDPEGFSICEWEPEDV